MAIRTDFTAGEVLAAADLNDTFGAKLNLAGGKILQIVRATDATDRSTTSTSFVDASLSVTITPQKSTSKVLLVFSAYGQASNTEGTSYTNVGVLQIADSSNNAISGGEQGVFGNTLTSAGGSIAYSNVTMVAQSTPATTSAVTYKMRFRVANANTTFLLVNSEQTGQMYAIEVSA